MRDLFLSNGRVNTWKSATTETAGQSIAGLISQHQGLTLPFTALIIDVMSWVMAEISGWLALLLA